MRLYEHEGKALLAGAGVEVPIGALWPDHQHVPFPVTVKAQLLEGGRGKRGGVRFAADVGEVEAAAQALFAGSQELPPAGAVLVEERLELDRELYLSLAVDRGARSGISLLAVRTGGIEVEESSQRDALRLPLSPLDPTIPAYAVRAVADHLELQRDLIAPLLEELWRVFREHDCLLLEVNPLAVTSEGRLVALDARIETDEAARYRHPEWPTRFEGTAFEVACREHGVVASELEGDVAIVTSGAGLGMATLDLVTRVGGRPACLVDLGGVVFKPQGVVREVIRLVCGLRPRAILVSAFLQVARFESVARELAAGFDEAEPPRLVVRAAGRREGRSAELLEAVGGSLHDHLDDACREAVGLSESARVA